ncbi:MAG: hypothetical protein JW827_01130 [Spirochaetes bacterium]|nr:hypothetical protein [Spirochaetota bacterium]
MQDVKRTEHILRHRLIQEVEYYTDKSGELALLDCSSLMTFIKDRNNDLYDRNNALRAFAYHDDFSKFENELMVLFSDNDSESSIVFYSAILLALLGNSIVSDYLFLYLHAGKTDTSEAEFKKEHEKIFMTSSGYEAGMAILALENLGFEIPDRNKYHVLRFVDPDYREES